MRKLFNTLQQDYLPRKKKYESHRETFGTRQSFSKTDTDATFMRMKEDHMMNGQLKPAYNLQVASNGQYVLAFDIFPNPTDTRTLKPFLSSLQTLDMFEYIVADAGYGGQENYHYILNELNKTPLIPYSTYGKEQSKKYALDPQNKKNWVYSQDTDTWVDTQGVRYSFKYLSHRTDRYGFQREFKVYESDDIQDTPELERLSKTESGKQKRLAINPAWEQLKDYVRFQLTSERGSSIYRQRKYDIETVFARMKGTFGVRRTHVRGNQSVYNDLGLVLMSMNLTKLTKQLVSFYVLFVKKYRVIINLFYIKSIITLFSMTRLPFFPVPIFIKGVNRKWGKIIA